MKKTKKMIIDPLKTPVNEMHAFLLGAVTPRPIAFASTIDHQGHVNLSPFSYFNCFGANPPILIFSPARRTRDNTTKHTYENILEVPEVVIHIVSFSMVHQMSLASSEYSKGINEFVKAGFTSSPSACIRPPRIEEAPVAFECKVLRVIPTGDQGGAGNLIICEVIMMHLKEEILDDDGRIDPFKLDVVARLGADWYCRVQGPSIFKIPKPVGKVGIGFDQIPERIRNSRVLTGNDLGILGSIEKLPGDMKLEGNKSNTTLHQARMKGEDAVHKLAHKYLEQGKVEEAWRVLLA